MKSFASSLRKSSPILLERPKELNAYSEGIITDTRGTISPPPQKEFSTTGISFNALFWLNCSRWVPSVAERQNTVHAASEVLHPENRGYHYLALYVTSIHRKNHLVAA